MASPLPLLLLAAAGAYALTRSSGKAPPAPPPREPGKAPTVASWIVSPVPAPTSAADAKTREDGISAVLKAASSSGAPLLIAFPLRRASAPGSPALPSGAELLGYGVAQRIAQEGDERAYYVRLTSIGQLAGGKAGELATVPGDAPAVGTDYRVTNAHLASIQEQSGATTPPPATETAPAATSPDDERRAEEERIKAEEAAAEAAVRAEAEKAAPVKKVPVAESRRFFPAAHFSGVRDPSRIRVIVLHSTEGGSAAGAASWFQNEASGGSTQLVAGEDGLFRTVDDLRIPWGAQGANSDGLHIELAGFAKWSRDEWLSRDRTLENAASAIGKWSKQYGIPLRYIEGAELADDVTRGVTTHVAVVRAYKKGDHFDPGPGFPIDVLLERAKAYT